jgi:hypothetical protein
MLRAATVSRPASCSLGAGRPGRSRRLGHVLRRCRFAAAVAPSAEEPKPLSKDDRRLQPVPAARNGLIEIDLGNRRPIREDAKVDPVALARVLDVLERR